MGFFAHIASHHNQEDESWDTTWIYKIKQVFSSLTQVSCGIVGTNQKTGLLKAVDNYRF